jgi:hypothetical protein
VLFLFGEAVHDRLVKGEEDVFSKAEGKNINNIWDANACDAHRQGICFRLRANAGP